MFHSNTVDSFARVRGIGFNGARVISETLRILPASNIPGTCTDSSVQGPPASSLVPVLHWVITSQPPANQGPRCTFGRHENSSIRRANTDPIRSHATGIESFELKTKVEERISKNSIQFRRVVIVSRRIGYCLSRIDEISNRNLTFTRNRKRIVKGEKVFRISKMYLRRKI